MKARHNVLMVLFLFLCSFKSISAQSENETDNFDPEKYMIPATEDIYKDPKVTPYLDWLKKHTGVEVVLRRAGVTNATMWRERIGSHGYKGLATLVKEIKKYPEGCLKTLGVKKFFLTGYSKEIFRPGYDNSGMYIPALNKLIVAIDIDPSHVEHAVHHEMSHVVDHKLGHLKEWKEWMDLNPTGFSYKKKPICFEEECYHDFYVQDCAFVSCYATSSDSEDRAEMMAFMMTGQKDIICNNLKCDGSIYSQEGPCPTRTKQIANCSEAYLQNKFKKLAKELNTVFGVTDDQKNYWNTNLPDGKFILATKK